MQNIPSQFWFVTCRWINYLGESADESLTILFCSYSIYVTGMIKFLIGNNPKKYWWWRIWFWWIIWKQLKSLAVAEHFRDIHVACGWVVNASVDFGLSNGDTALNKDSCVWNTDQRIPHLSFETQLVTINLILMDSEDPNSE